MNGGLGPVSAPAPARPAGTGSAASDADAGETGFAAALEDAQGPASTTHNPSGAAKARPGAPAKTAVATTLPPATQPARLDAPASGGQASPAEPTGAEAGQGQDPNPSAGGGDPLALDLSQVLPGWPAAAPTRASTALDPAATERQDSALRRGTRIDAQQREPGDLAPRQTELRPATATLPAGARPAPSLSTTAAVATEAPPAASLRAAAETPSALPLPALHAGFMPATAASVAAAAATTAPFEAQLAAALDSAAFAPALATQVSWLVREGVHHARLSLNPAEMGPVTVQIALDGTQARVDFSADLATTRAAIESSLPHLAAALHESGLKLAGGGVFDGQQRPGTPGERGQSDSRPGRSGGPLDLGAEALGLGRASAQVQRGLVDLVA